MIVTSITVQFSFPGCLKTGRVAYGNFTEKKKKDNNKENLCKSFNSAVFRIM